MKHNIKINLTYHNESTALERSVMNYSGEGVCVSGEGVRVSGTYASITGSQPTHSAFIVVKSYICSVRKSLRATHKLQITSIRRQTCK